MEKYRKIKVVGKGNFGYAMLVQSVIDRKFYIMKVMWIYIYIYIHIYIGH